MNHFEVKQKICELATYQIIRIRNLAVSISWLALSLYYSLLCNPVVPVFDLSGGSHLMIILGTVIPFAASVIWLKSGMPSSDLTF